MGELEVTEPAADRVGRRDGDGDDDDDEKAPAAFQGAGGKPKLRRGRSGPRAGGA